MIKYVVFSRFNHIHRTLDDPRTKRCLLNPDWWKQRVGLFEKYTLKSLKRQAFKDFEIWTPISPHAPKEGVKYLLESAKKHGFHAFYDVADNKTKFSKPYTEAIKRCGDADWLVLINIDSDDIYRSDAIRKISLYKPRPGLTLIFEDGFIYDPRNDRLAYYEMKNSPPPFFAICYSREALKDEESFLEYEKEWKLDGFHYELLRTKNHKLIGSGHYSYIVHGTNTSTAWQREETARHIVYEFKDKVKEDIKGFLGL